MVDAYKYIEEKNILYKSEYGVLFTDYLSNRFRHRNVRLFDLDNFDKIIQYLNEPPQKKADPVLMIVDDESDEE